MKKISQIIRVKFKDKYHLAFIRQIKNGKIQVESIEGGGLLWIFDKHNKKEYNQLYENSKRKNL